MKMTKTIGIALVSAFCGSIFTYSTMAQTQNSSFLQIKDVEHMYHFLLKNNAPANLPKPSIPKNWKLISVIPTETGADLWFQDEKGNVYSGMTQTAPRDGRVYLSDIVFKIPAQE